MAAPRRPHSLWLALLGLAIAGALGVAAVIERRGAGAAGPGAEPPLPAEALAPPQALAPAQEEGPARATACAAKTRCVLADGGWGVCCAGSCRDTERDPAHCGVCAIACEASEVCLMGSCVARGCAGLPDGVDCLQAQGEAGVCCAGACRDADAFATDPLQCGSCGGACPLGALCREGDCVRPGATAEGMDCPAFPCAPGRSCGETTQRCLRARCQDQPDGVPCKEDSNGRPQTCCGGRCLDPQVSRLDCGACGRRCPPGSVCNAGTCQLVEGCPAAGACVLPNGQTGACCGSQCTDLDREESCGGCGNRCAPGQVCQAGDCVAASCAGAAANQPCAAEGPQAHLCCAGACLVEAAFDSDPLNCGACGLRCAPASECQGGACRVAPDAGAAAGCAEGETLVARAGVCVAPSCAGRDDGAACALRGGYAFCCGGRCLAALDTVDDCGLCGRRCPAGTSCASGRCRQAPR